MACNSHLQKNISNRLNELYTLTLDLSLYNFDLTLQVTSCQGCLHVFLCSIFPKYTGQIFRFWGRDWVSSNRHLHQGKTQAPNVWGHRIVYALKTLRLTTYNEGIMDIKQRIVVEDKGESKVILFSHCKIHNTLNR